MDIVRSPLRGVFRAATIAMRWDTVTSEADGQQLNSTSIPAGFSRFNEVPHERVKSPCLANRVEAGTRAADYWPEAARAGIGSRTESVDARITKPDPRMGELGPVWLGVMAVSDCAKGQRMGIAAKIAYGA